jgi:hypothetical protein
MKPQITNMIFNATFNNISVIMCRSDLLMEETGVPEENHEPASSYRQTGPLVFLLPKII